MKTKLEKQFEREKLVAQTVVDIRAQREDLEKLAEGYFEMAVEAAQLGQDEFSNELLENIVEFEDFGENLHYLEVKIKTAAITSKTIGKLRELPKALAACRSILCKGPNFKALGKDMGDLFSSLGTARNQFREFRIGLGKTNDPVYTEIFGKERKSGDPKYAQRLSDKKKALEARIIGNTIKTPAPMEVKGDVDKSTDASIDAIAAMLDEEKGRK